MFIYFFLLLTIIPLLVLLKCVFKIQQRIEKIYNRGDNYTIEARYKKK